jgi:xanthine dehydrogenase YagT iron-sulfur-binding subunit
MESAEGSKIASSDLTRRELLAVAAATGGALVGGDFMPGAIPPASAQGTAGMSTSLDVILRVNGTDQTRYSRPPRAAGCVFKHAGCSTTLMRL